MIFHVTLEQAEDGWIVAECPALPGCVSQGRDEKEALENIREAIQAWLWAEDQKAVAALPDREGAPPIVAHRRKRIGQIAACATGSSS
jgi:predicted RNase H-like HicB family nuclease